MKRILYALMILMVLISASAYATLTVISRWISCDNQHSEFLYPRVNGGGFDRYYQVYPASTVDYDTTMTTHEWGDLAASTPIAEVSTTSKAIDLWKLGVTSFTLHISATDISIDTCVTLIRMSPDGVTWSVIDSADATSDGTARTKFYSADSSKYARFLQVVIMTNDTHNAAAVVRNKIDVTFNGFGPGAPGR